MSILDNIPLEVGTRYYNNKILDWNPETQKYLVKFPYRDDPRWLSRERVEAAHLLAVKPPKTDEYTNR